MVWNEVKALDERGRFVQRAIEGEESISQLCARYGISRKTGHKWLNRFLKEGRSGLADRSRAPLNHPNRVDAELLGALMRLRRRHPSWGPRKLLAYLEDREPEQGWPSASTIGSLLKRAGLVGEKEPPFRPKPGNYDLRPIIADRPNALWTVDFKGKFRTLDGRWCIPLTLKDAYSRFLLECRIVRPNESEVACCLERAFRRHGLPDAIRSDNGTPFGAPGLAGLSHLSVQWMKLGIEIQRTVPGHPEQNPRHERFHRTLHEETANPPRANERAQQRAFDQFRRIYNDERPHEALGQRTPSSLYVASQRRLPNPIPEFEYASDMVVRRVQSDGQMKWNRELVYVSEALHGEWIGLRQIHPARWRIYVGSLPIATLDATQNKVLPYIRHNQHIRDAV